MKNKKNALSEDLEILIDHHNNPMVLSDLNGKILAINDKLATIFGKNKDELIGTLGFDSIETETGIHRRKIIEKVIKTKKQIEFIDQERGRWWKAKFQPIFDKEGNVVKLAYYIQDITEKKEAEEKFSNLFKNSNDAIFIHDLEGNIIDVNRRSLDIFGYSKKDMLSLNIKDLHPSYVYKKSKWAFQRILKDGSLKFEIDFKNKNGDIIPTEVSSSIFDIEGKKVIQGIVRDITKRKEILSKLFESEEKFRMLSDQSLMGIAIVQDDSFKYVNNALLEMGGYKEEDFLQGGIAYFKKIVHKDDLQFVMKQLAKKLSGEKDVATRYSFRVFKKSGEERHIEVFSKTVIFQKRKADFITFIDITKQKKALENLRTSETKLQHLLVSSPAAIYCAKPSGNYSAIFISDNIKNISGFNSKDFVNNPSFWNDHIHPDDRSNVYKEIDYLFSNNKCDHSLEYRFRCKNGGYKWINDVMTLLYDEKGKPKEIIGYWADISKRKEDEKEIKTTKDYLQNVIDSASEIIFTIGSDFKIKTWNKSARMITGYKQSHVVGKSINNLTLFENQSEINDYIKTILNGKTASLEEITINTSFGIKKQFSVSPSFIRDESKNVNEVLFVCRDITYEKERHGKLQFGQSYLISESTSEAAVEIFAGMLRSGHPGLYIGRTSDSEIKNIFTDVTPTIVKLSKEKDKKHLTCSNFEELLRTIKDYVSKEKQSIVLLDRIEYLIINSSFESVIKNIYLLNDMIGKHNCLLLLRISPSLLDKTQMVILKEELRQLPERQIDDVQLEETLFEILDYVQIENKRNAILSYSRIGKQFSISKVTTQRRIESLLEKGLVFTKKQGRIKTIYITDKGKNLLAQRTII